MPNVTDMFTDLEERTSVASLEALHHERRRLVDANATLIARYGAFGMHDDYRKQFVEALKLRARMDLSASRDKKPTEGEIDAHAYGSDDYARFLDSALAEKVEWLRIDTRITEIEELIRSREIELQTYNKELALQR